jgi:hypothetical protein
MGSTPTINAQFCQHLFTVVSSAMDCFTMQRPNAWFMLFPLFKRYVFRLRGAFGIVLPDAEGGRVYRPR